jgi:hypothetical protein
VGPPLQLLANTHISLLLQLLCFAIVLLFYSIIQLPAFTSTSSFQPKTALRNEYLAGSTTVQLTDRSTALSQHCRLADLRSCSSCCSTESFSVSESCCCGKGATSSLLAQQLALRCLCLVWLWLRVGTATNTECEAPCRQWGTSLDLHTAG